MFLFESEEKLEEITPIDILELNDYCLENLFDYLDIVSQIHLAKTCRKFRQIFIIWTRRHRRTIGFADMTALKKVVTKIDYNKLIFSELTWQNLGREVGKLLLEWFTRQEYFKLLRASNFNFLRVCHTFHKIISNWNAPDKKLLYDHKEYFFKTVGRYIVKSDYGIPDSTVLLMQKYCPHLQEIHFTTRSKPKNYIKTALSLRSLKSIHFHSCYTNDEMKEYVVLLQQLPNLRCLSLTNLKYAGKDLDKLTNLQELHIYDCPVVSMYLMSCFRRMKNLRILKLAKTIKPQENDFLRNEKECKKLAKLSKLRYLYLKAKYIRDPTNLLNYLTNSRLSNRLEVLKIPSFNLDYENAKCLKKICTLKSICVHITDGSCLEQIALINNLLELTVCSYALAEDSDFLFTIKRCKTLNVFNISYRFKNLKQFCLDVIEALRENRNPRTRRPLQISFENILIDQIPEFSDECKNARDLVKFNFHWHFHNKRYD